MKLPGLRNLLLISLLAGVLIVASAALWLLASESALSRLIAYAVVATGNRLSVVAPTGAVAGPIEIDELNWEDTDWIIRARKVRIEWSPGALLRRQIRIEHLGVESLSIHRKSASEAGPPPAALQLPIALLIGRIELGALRYGELPAVRNIVVGLESDGGQHRIDLSGAQVADVSISGKSSVDGRGPITLDAGGTLTGIVQERPLRIDIDAIGPIEKLSIHATARQGVEGEATLLATPFAAVPVSLAQVSLRGIDPSAWHQSAPRANIDLQADMTSDTRGFSGHFALANLAAGPIDRDQLPVQRITGEMRWEGDRAQLGSLSVELPGNGKLAGSGSWKAHAFLFDLMADRVDPENLHSKMRSASLHGAVSGSIGRDVQSVQLSLNDPRFSIVGNLAHRNQELSVSKMRLAASNAVLTASGSINLDEHSSYSVRGELRGFDPSRFAKVPAATINADLSARGRLAPHSMVDANFTLTGSRIFGQAVSGKGNIDFDGEHLRASEVSLLVGENRFNARGAFGTPGKTLVIDIEAPRLEFPAVNGDLSGRLQLSGTRKELRITGKIASKRLDLTGKGNLSNAFLELNGGNTADDPMQLELRAETLGTPSLKEPVRAVRLTVDGVNRDHQFAGALGVTSNRSLTFTGQGGLIEANGRPGWRGALSDARLAGDNDRTLARLVTPAPVEVFAEEWKVGPLELSDEQRVWQAVFSAEASETAFRGKLEANGKKIGLLSGQLLAGMETPWSIAKTRPWQGRLQVAIPDLGWIGGLLGETWKSEGQLDGEIIVSGTPGKPEINGNAHGEKLSLRIREQGLNLARGQLDAVIKDNRLVLRKLTMESELKPVPQALRLTFPDATSLIGTPGKISVSGALTLGQTMDGENGSIAFQMSRLGLYQQPDQWILISGHGKLNWGNNALTIQGDATADAGYWRLTSSGAPQLGEDVVIRQPGKRTEPDNDRTRIEIDFGTDIGKRFLFSGGGLDTRVEGNVRWRKSGQDILRATGSIHALGGRFEAYGQQLDIERGILSFQGLPENPAVDVRAWRKGLPVEAGVDVTGTAKKPIVKLISQPELSDAEKFSWLVLGHGPEQMSPSDAAILVSAAGSALGVGSGSGNQLKQTLGIDEFGLRQGTVSENMSRMPTSRVAGNSTTGPASSESQTVSVGKRISADTVIAYEQTLGTAETVLKLTHNLTRRLAVIGRVGTDNALDIFYSLTTDRR